LKKKKLKKPKENNLKNFFIATLIVFGLAGCEDTTTPEDTTTEQTTGVKFTGANDNGTTTPETTPVSTTTEEAGTTNETGTGTTPTEVETGTETEVEPTETETTPEESTETEQVEGVTLADLTAEDLAEIESLRQNIFAGISVGEGLYVNQVNLALEDLGLYDGGTQWGAEVDLPEVSSCPFVEFYNNTKPLSEASCEYLVDQARSSAYSKLAAALQTERQNFNSELSEQDFWYEQGAISGLEKTRVVIQVQMKTGGLCNQTPTAVESSKEKGLVVGRQHFINTMNNWLTTNEYKADYPVMSDPIEVWDANIALLDPVYDEAVNTISQAVTSTPLCQDFVPTDGDEEFLYAQAKTDFSNAVEQGITDEFSLAAVKIFEVVPCNVSDPIVIDLNGNGKFDVTAIEKGVNFAMTGRRSQAVSWVNGDGFLFFDANQNGLADNGLELLGTDIKSKSGFDQLAWFDTNKDGTFSSADKQFDQFFVWNDVNSNGTCEKTEVFTLSKFNITSIPLTTQTSNTVVNGNLVKTTVRAATTKENASILMGDINLRSAAYPRL
jgi:hypothetical protein